MNNKIMNIIIKYAKSHKNITLQSDLSELELDSILFIQMVVELENEFNFEFDDEKLIMTEFPTVNSIIKYVEFKSKLCS